jgi:hypothetical protein
VLPLLLRKPRRNEEDEEKKKIFALFVSSWLVFIVPKIKTPAAFSARRGFGSHNLVVLSGRPIGEQIRPDRYSDDDNNDAKDQAADSQCLYARREQGSVRND